MDQRTSTEELLQRIADLEAELGETKAILSKQDNDLSLANSRMEVQEVQFPALQRANSELNDANNQLTAANATYLVKLTAKEAELLEAEERINTTDALLSAKEEQCATLEAECAATKAQVERLQESASHKMDDDEIIRYNEIAALKKQVEKNVKKLGDWNSLGNKLRGDETIMVCGKRYTKLDCFVMALGGSNDPLIWRSIGGTLPRDGSITVKGVNYSTLQCLIKCVSDDHPYCWSGLGRYLSGDECVVIGGISYNKKQCFVKALTIYPRYKLVWYNLGMLLTSDDTVEVKGAKLNSKACYVNALKSDSLVDYWRCHDVFDDTLDMRACWKALASIMQNEEGIQIDGTSYTKDECLNHAT